MRGNTLSSQQSRHQSRGESSSGRRRKNADDREQRQHRRTTTSSPAAPATGPVVRESGSTATAGAAAQQQTRPRRNLHCLPRQTDANNLQPSIMFVLKPMFRAYMHVHCSASLEQQKLKTLDEIYRFVVFR